MFGSLGFTEILVLLVAVGLLFFGAKRIPDLLTGLGRGISNFVAELRPNDRGEQRKLPGVTDSTTDKERIESHRDT